MLFVISIIAFFFFRQICMCKHDLTDTKMLLWGGCLVWKKPVPTFLEHKLSVTVYGSRPDQFGNSVCVLPQPEIIKANDVKFSRFVPAALGEQTYHLSLPHRPLQAPFAQIAAVI